MQSWRTISRHVSSIPLIIFSGKWAIKAAGDSRGDDMCRAATDFSIAWQTRYVGAGPVLKPDDPETKRLAARLELAGREAGHSRATMAEDAGELEDQIVEAREFANLAEVWPYSPNRPSASAAERAMQRTD
jgi:hypothetical protein